MSVESGCNQPRVFVAGTPATPKGPAGLMRFWRTSKTDWFSHDPAFDLHFHERFLCSHLSSARFLLDDWADTPEGALALLILLDQFPRNAFRGTARMYATAPLARHYARKAESVGHMGKVDTDLKLFFCLPFAHSEDVGDQDLSVAPNVRLGQPRLSHAEGHRDIIRRFGRFPHRNVMLGRQTTEQDDAFLDSGGFTG